ncbi:Protein 60A [Echinococcus granulosus]|uniref:Anti dorsalizing morphogenetic protein 1a n=1 Tax=Echinococcus granulosus TaxID=6210 RepID=A0A068WSG4_ECHGR|nr:Protein 60A [Echinococcus granulosus]CDS21402.1 anti dorsalizing morphogenetic protein 1a [Echinococcus granulosus]
MGSHAAASSRLDDVCARAFDHRKPSTPSSPTRTCVEEQASQRPDLGRPRPPANAAYPLCKLADDKFFRVSIQSPTSITTLVLILLLVYATAFTLGVEGSVEEWARVPPDFLTRLYQSTTDERGRLFAPPPYYADSVLAFLDEKKTYNSASQYEYFFNVTQLPQNTLPIQAEFHLYRTVGGKEDLSVLKSQPPLPSLDLQPPSSYSKKLPPQPFIFLKLFYVKIDPEGRGTLQLLEMKRIFRHYYGWIVFNINEALTHWLHSNQKNAIKGLIVGATYSNRTPIRDRQELNFVQRYFHNAGRLQPCLIVYCRDWTAKSSYHTTSNDKINRRLENDDLAQDFLRNDPWRYTRVYMHEYPRPKSEVIQPALQRSKRNTVQFTKRHSTVTMKNRPPRRYCRRRKMVVSFAQLNMTDWILAPVTFDAGVCTGACTFPLGQEAHPTNHAVLQSVWSRFLQTATFTSTSASGASAQQVPSPCCVPHELEALPMLYFQTDNRVVLNHRPDMVVRSCGCK